MWHKKEGKCAVLDDCFGHFLLKSQVACDTIFLSMHSISIFIFHTSYQGELLEESFVNRPSSEVSSMSWHPMRKIIAVGWTNGELITWNEHDHDLHEVYSIHKSKINIVKWSHNGHRLVTGDQVNCSCCHF